MKRAYNVVAPLLITAMANRTDPAYRLVTYSNISVSTLSSTTAKIPQIFGPLEGTITVATALITMACILGNSLVILSVFQVHKLKTPSNYLIVSLAVSDWLVGLVVMPLAIVYEVLGAWPLSHTACVIWVTSDVTLSTASILNLMMISIDRYRIITAPFKYAQTRTRGRMAIYICSTWLLSLIISTTPLFIGWLPEQGRNNDRCQVNQKLGYQMYATIGAFYLPLLVMIGMYGRIYFISRKLLKDEAKRNPRPIGGALDQENSSEASSERLPLNEMRKETITTIPDSTVAVVNGSVDLPIDHSLAVKQMVMDDISLASNSPTQVRRKHHHNHLQIPSDNNNHHQRGSGPLKKLSVATLTSVKKFLTRHTHKGNSHAIKTLGIIMGLFIACWLPFFVLAFVAPICGERCDIPHWVWGLLTWLGYTNSCFNPVIYAMFNREFRTPFREILCCRCQKINESVRHTDYLYQYGSST